MVTSVLDRRDALHGGQQFKHPCRCVAASNIALSGFQTVDGVALSGNDANLRVLVTGQTDATQNGIYNASSGIWERAKDFDGNRDVVQGTLVYVVAGTAYASTVWRVTTADPVVIGTSALTFAQYPPLVQDDLNAIEALAGMGLAARTAANQWALRTLTGPAAGIAVTNGDGVAGNPTIALANDLAALENLNSNGIAVRTNTDTWAVRTLTGGNGVAVTNGSGASGNPTLALDINGLTEDTSPAHQTDYVATYDASAAGYKKVLLDNITGGRTPLTVNTTFYVRSDGNNSNNGLTDSAGGAFQTWQGAYDHIVANYHFNNKTVTIQKGSGGSSIFNVAGNIIVISGWVGSGVFRLLGDTSDPDNADLRSTGGDCIRLTGHLGGEVVIDGFTIRTTTSGYGINNESTGHVSIGTSGTAHMTYGNCAGGHLAVTWKAASMHHDGGYTIDGDAPMHYEADAGIMQIDSGQVTISGTRSFSQSFVRVRNHGTLICLNSFNTNVAAGFRFQVNENGFCQVEGNGTDFFPGNADGVVTTGGVYSGSTLLHSAINVGVAATARFSQTTAGLMTVRNDQNGIFTPVAIQNFGIAAANAGATVQYTFGTGGASGGIAAEMATLSTEDWSVAANRSAKYRFNVRTDNSLVAELDISQGLSVRPTTPIPAGGSVTLGYKATDTANFGVFFGSGAPSLSAAKGSLYLRSDGTTTNNRAYINTDGGTTWTALTTAV